MRLPSAAAIKPLGGSVTQASLTNKNRPSRDGLNTSWAQVSDRIGETGFEPAASCSQSRDTFLVATGLWGVPGLTARRAARSLYPTGTVMTRRSHSSKPNTDLSWTYPSAKGLLTWTYPSANGLSFWWYPGAKGLALAGGMSPSNAKNDTAPKPAPARELRKTRPNLLKKSFRDCDSSTSTTSPRGWGEHLPQLRDLSESARNRQTRLAQ